jgi:hypothetical protein
MYWHIYRQLYAHRERRIALLNETGSMVFYVLQHLLLDEVTLAICRLPDPATTGRRENHSLERLVVGVQAVDLANNLNSILAMTQSLAKPFRERRNRTITIAHSDRATKLKLERNPLARVSREMVGNTLEQIHSLMNAYDYNFFNNTNMYQEIILPLGADGDFLRQQLRRAVAFLDLERGGKIDREL